MRRVVYLCLQATREGQASYAHVHEIINGLRRRGWTVDLFEPSYAKKRTSPGPFRRFLGFLWVQVRLWLRGKPELLYVRHHFAAWPTAFLARLLRVPVVQEINGPYADLFVAWPWTRKLARVFTWLMRSQIQWADVVIVVTPQLADWARSEGAKGKVFVIPNGANTDLFHPAATLDRSLDIEKPYVIFFGALAPWQGVDVMLAATESPEWPSGVSLVVVGDGAERTRVVESVSRSHRVRYLGSQPYAKMPGLIANALAGLSPEVDAGGRATHAGLFPLKVFETLACGIPVVVSDYPGMADLVREGKCGLVVPPGDPAALARAVRYLYEHPDERQQMGRKGRELVEREHSWDKRAAVTAEVLGTLVRPDTADTA